VPQYIDSDVTKLLESAQELRALGKQLDEEQRDAIRSAVRFAVQEATSAAVERARKLARRGYVITVIVACLICLCVSLPFALAGYEAATHAQTDVASIAASGEVDKARTANANAARADLTAANAALAAAGLATVPDPGPAAPWPRITEAVGEARGTLRALAEVQARGVVLPGVSTPDPRTGAFPNLAGR
jgi:hypothetical protein